MEDEHQINLKRYKRYERKIPWELILRIVIAAVLFATIYIGTKFFLDGEDHTQIKEEGIEVEIQ